jgi:hypothetical protein
MTEEEAKEVIRDDPKGDIMRRLEALEVAESVLGTSCTMGEILKWAEGERNDS